MKWHWMPEHGDGYTICDANGRAVAFIDSVAVQHVDVEENRDLIVSAPELHEALIELVELVEEVIQEKDNTAVSINKMEWFIAGLRERGLV